MNSNSHHFKTSNVDFSNEIQKCIHRVTFFLFVSLFTGSVTVASGIMPISLPLTDTLKPILPRLSKTPDLPRNQLTDTAIKPPVFKILSLNDLKKDIGGFKLVPLPVPVQPAAKLNTGNAAYKTGNGVVLTALNSIHTTLSKLQLLNVNYNYTIAYDIKRNAHFQVGQQVNSQGNSLIGKKILFVQAFFNDLPTAPHTYLLTLGTSVDTDHTKITVFNGDLSDIQVFENTKLVSNEATSEIRILFTYANIKLGTNGGYGLNVKVEYTSDMENSLYVIFDHIQLVQLD